MRGKSTAPTEKGTGRRKPSGFILSVDVPESATKIGLIPGLSCDKNAGADDN